MTETNAIRKQKILEIYPVKISRRILIFLGDIFLNLILSIIFFELVVFQISRPIIGYDNLINLSDINQKQQYAILYDRGLLYFDNEDGESNRFKLSIALETTNYYFLSFYSDDMNINLSKYDVFYKYFVEIKGDGSTDSLNYLNSLYLKYGASYFDQGRFTILGTYALKDNYKNQFVHNYIPGDQMSQEAQTSYENFTTKVFLNLYSELLNDVKTTDLSSPLLNKTYVELANDTENIENTLKTNYIICAYISFFISSIVLFLLIPFINEKHESSSELILKVERINKKTLNYIKKPFIFNIFLLKMIDSLILIFLVPIFRVGFSYLFALPELYVPALLSLIVIIVNFFLTCFTKLNTSLKEITTDTILVDTVSLDYYYQQKEILNEQ